MDFGTFGPPEVTHYFGDKHTHDSDHAECGIAEFCRYVLGIYRLFSNSHCLCEDCIHM